VPVGTTDSEEVTVAACATPQGSSGVAIIRITGSKTVDVISRLFSRPQDIVQKPRTAFLRVLCDPQTGQKLDSVLVLFFQAPASFTGEDAAEIHCHGNSIIIQLILRLLFKMGCSPAQPGEFTKRAYLNGKLDLLQAEAISDVISATSERALRLAQEQLDGKLSQVVRDLGEPLRDVLAEIEASLDFPEEDISPEGTTLLSAKLAQVEKRFELLLQSYDTGRKIKDGLRVLFWGLPNSGKSSLLNTLLGEERAIVTEISGTTRDTIEEEITLFGLRCILCDSAGIIESQDRVEQIGIEKARQKLVWADLVLFMVDASASHEQADAIQELHNELIAAQVPFWIVMNKIDLMEDVTETRQRSSISHQGSTFAISTYTKAGIEDLTSRLYVFAQNAQHVDSESGAILTNERHRSSLECGLEHLKEARRALNKQLPYEMVSEDIRHALSSLEELIGRTTVEDVLGRIFSKFCIGK
jgi:tRNA modification GTPase